MIKSPLCSIFYFASSRHIFDENFTIFFKLCGLRLISLFHVSYYLSEFCFHNAEFLLRSSYLPLYPGNIVLLPSLLYIHEVNCASIKLIVNTIIKLIVLPSSKLDSLQVNCTSLKLTVHIGK